MHVDGVGNSSDNATGSGARIINVQNNNSAIFAFGNDAAIRSEAEALHLQAENREELCTAAREAECAQGQSHGICECEAQVNAEFHAEVMSAEARISRVCEERAQALQCGAGSHVVSSRVQSRRSPTPPKGAGRQACGRCCTGLCCTCKKGRHDAAQNQILQEELEELQSREEKSKPRARG